MHGPRRMGSAGSWAVVVANTGDDDSAFRLNPTSWNQVAAGSSREPLGTFVPRYVNAMWPSRPAVISGNREYVTPGAPTAMGLVQVLPRSRLTDRYCRRP